MARAAKAKRKLSPGDATLLQQNVNRYTYVTRISAHIQDYEGDDPPPPPLVAYYTREEWSLETLIAELLRYYRARGVTFKELKEATGFTMADVKELANAQPRTA